MKRKTSTLLKIFASSVAGALIFTAGLYLLAGSSETALYGHLKEPAGWIQMSGGIALVLASAFLTGIVAVFVSDPHGFVSSIRHAIAAGFLAGVLLWLGSNVMLAQGHNGLMSALPIIGAGIVNGTPFFAFFSVAFAFVAIFGGILAELVLVLADKLLSHDKTAQ